YYYYHYSTSASPCPFSFSTCARRILAESSQQRRAFRGLWTTSPHPTGERLDAMIPPPPRCLVWPATSAAPPTRWAICTASPWVHPATPGEARGSSGGR